MSAPITALNKDCLSVIFSFLDITEHKDKRSAATVLNALNIREKSTIKQIKKYWNINSKYTNIAYADGSQMWYMNGKLHRDQDQPAIIRADGTREWWVNGQCHRDNDLPAIVDVDGTQEWWINGQCHRDDGPAIILADGTQYWYKNGQRHRAAFCHYL